MLPMTSTLPTLAQQAERLIDLGVDRISGLPAGELADLAAPNGTDAAPATGSLLVIHPELAPPSVLAPLLEHAGLPGFVVVDMADLDQFAPLDGLPVPAGPAYLIDSLDRGDEMANWSPDEALPAITGAGRTPLTVLEGIHWVLQQPETLERNHCFMTIGSRKRTAKGTLDARTPAIWISNGTGRDGRANRNAPKVGWCWAGNRHTWLGFASATGRRPLSSPGQVAGPQH